MGATRIVPYNWAMLTRTPWLPTLLLAALGVCASICRVALAGEAGSATEYRLQLARPAAFALPSRAQARPAAAGGLAARPYAALIERAAQEAALDPALIHAVVKVESGYNPSARSPKGAIGLMQLLPETAARYGVTRGLYTPEANLRAGTRYLSELVALFHGRLDLALAAYNAGEKAVLAHGSRIPPFRETRNYVPAVLARFHELRESAEPSSLRTRVIYLPGTRLAPDFGKAIAASRP
jgi:soluble lytic murein transglycosylase-like protein